MSRAEEFFSGSNRRKKMETQRRVFVIDLFGVSYDGTLPSIVFACDEI